MKIDRSFAGKAKNVDEAPEPFRQSLQENIEPDETVSLLVYSPVFKSAGRRLDATVLAITDERWLMLAVEENGNVAVRGASFEDTLLLELTEILLFGQMKIDIASTGSPPQAHFSSMWLRRKCIARPLTLFSMLSKDRRP
jgi:hypothetical protein